MAILGSCSHSYMKSYSSRPSVIPSRMSGFTPLSVRDSTPIPYSAFRSHCSVSEQEAEENRIVCRIRIMYTYVICCSIKKYKEACTPRPYAIKLEMVVSICLQNVEATLLLRTYQSFFVFFHMCSANVGLAPTYIYSGLVQDRIFSILSQYHCPSCCCSYCLQQSTRRKRRSGGSAEL